MKVLHLIDSLNYGGAETLMMSYIPLMNEYEHLVVTLNGPNIYPRNGYEYFQLDMHYRKDFFKIIRRLRKLIREKEVGIVHAHSFWTNIISRFATPGSLSLFNHYHFADYDTMRKKSKVKLMILIDKLKGHKKLHRLGVSVYMGEILKKRFPGKEITVIPNFISCQKNSLNHQSSESDYMRVVAVGNCNTEKNYETILGAFSELKNLPVSLEVFGGGDKLEYYRKKVRELELDNIYFRGHMERANEKLKDFDLFLSASVSETFGLVVLEAVCARLPLILSDIPAFREIAPSSAVFFTPNDSFELASLIKKLIPMQTVTDYNEYDRILKKYSSESFISQLKSLYNSN